MSFLASDDIIRIALQDERKQVRLAALSSLTKLPASQLSKHVKEITLSALQDLSEQVCMEACNPEHASKEIQQVQKDALRALEKVPAEEMAKSVKSITTDGSTVVDKGARRILPKLPAVLANEVIRRLLQAKCLQVRLEALRLMVKLPANDRLEHVVATMECALQDVDPKLRQFAVECLEWALQNDGVPLPTTHAMEKSSMQELMDRVKSSIMRGLRATDTVIRQEAIKCLAKLSVDEVASAIKEHCLCWDVAQLKLAVNILSPKAWQKLLAHDMPDEDGFTWLHRAASKNNLELCKVLVEHVGVPVRPQDGQGREPYQVTASSQVDAYLRSQISYVKTRFGSGDAMNEALRDTSRVTRLVWYTIPLPGIAGYIGGKHSFVYVTTQNSIVGNSYIIEKAQPRCENHDGTFVSFWQGNDGMGVGVNLVSEAEVLRKIEQPKEGVTINNLIEVAKQAGPYRLSTCNCHDIARDLFNTCCKEDAQRMPLDKTPNRWMALLCGDLVSAGSRSTSHGPDSATSTSKSDGSLHASAGANVPSGFNTMFDTSEDVYTYAAAYLSSVVYDDKLINCILEMPKLEPGFIRVTNSLEELLELKRQDRHQTVPQ